MHEFKRVLVHAYRAGASGYLAGRAIWLEPFQRFPDWDGIRAGLRSQSLPYMRELNALTDSAARPWHHVPPFMLHSYKLIYDLEGDNDGVVSVASAQWGQHLETWPADHLHVINKRLVPEIRNRTGDIVPYYLRALDRVVSS